MLIMRLAKTFLSRGVGAIRERARWVCYDLSLGVNNSPFEDAVVVIVAHFLYMGVLLTFGITTNLCVVGGVGGRDYIILGVEASILLLIVRVTK